MASSGGPELGDPGGDPGMVSRTLEKLVAVAADTYAAACHRLAIGVAETLRAGPRPSVPALGRQPPALENLGAALEALPPGPLAAPLRNCAARVPWTDAAFERPGKLAGRYAFVEIVGPKGLAPRQDLRFGLYLQAPETYYPAHSHAAEEFYYVLGGTAEWQQADGAFAARAPGTLVHHAAWERHAMATAREPMLAMWLWTGDLDTSAYRIDPV